MTKPTSWTLKVGGRRLAAGLAWVPLVAGDASSQSTRRQFKDALKAAGQRYGVLSAAARPYPLAGIVQNGEGKKSYRFSRQPPVALWFAACVQRPTVYVEQSERGYWLLIASGGDVDPRGDRLLTAQQAASLLADVNESAVMAGHELELIAHPETDCFPLDTYLTARRAGLESILSGIPPRPKVHKAVGLPTWAPVTLFAVVATALGLMFARNVTQHLEERRVQAQAEQSRRAEAARELARRQIHERAVSAAGQRALSAITATPGPLQFFGACVSAADGLRTAIAGWPLAKVECLADGTLMATYSGNTPGAGTEDDFRAAATGAGGKVHLRWFGTSATIAESLSTPPARKELGLAELADAQTVGSLLASHTRSAAAAFPTLTITAAEPRPASLPPVDGTEVGPAFQSGKLTVMGTGTWLAAQAIPDSPFVRLTRIEISPTDYRWTADGEFVASID